MLNHGVSWYARCLMNHGYGMLSHAVPHGLMTLCHSLSAFVTWVCGHGDGSLADVFWRTQGLLGDVLLATAKQPLGATLHP